MCTDIWYVYYQSLRHLPNFDFDCKTIKNMSFFATNLTNIWDISKEDEEKMIEDEPQSKKRRLNNEENSMFV